MSSDQNHGCLLYRGGLYYPCSYMGLVLSHDKNPVINQSVFHGMSFQGLNVAVAQVASMDFC